MKDYEVVIGLEVHVELATKTKIFCGCSTAFGGAPNTHTCPVCTGMPGSLPVLNKKVVEYAMAVGLATNCSITRDCKFDRKNYFYPDNPQNYQISQLYLPICRDGHVDVKLEDGTEKSIRIHEIHMEEDAGKLIRQRTRRCFPGRQRTRRRERERWGRTSWDLACCRRRWPAAATEVVQRRSDDLIRRRDSTSPYVSPPTPLCRCARGPGQWTWTTASSLQQHLRRACRSRPRRRPRHGGRQLS